MAVSMRLASRVILLLRVAPLVSMLVVKPPSAAVAGMVQAVVVCQKAERW